MYGNASFSLISDICDIGDSCVDHEVNHAHSGPISADLIAQTTVAKVECPECGAMRTLHPQGPTVTFPSHPKRKTGTPRDEVR
jgi:hypothetical protein